MIEATVCGVIKDTNGNVSSYKLRDTSGKEMIVSCNSIIDAMKANKIHFDNLYLDKNNNLVYTDSVIPAKIDSNNDENRMQELVKILNNARMVYEQGKDEIMSNYEYDALYDELEKLENKIGKKLNNSPTVQVGYEVLSELPKEQHESKMLSLGKTKETSDLIDFLGNKDGVLSWKMDGLTVVLTYNNGELVKAVTRGNGEIGEVVTSNAKHFKNVPQKISYKGKLVMRGEAIIKYSDFEMINSNLLADEKYKNPRNLCSGSVRQLDSKISASRNINWYCFEVIEVENKPKTYVECMMLANNLGFKPVRFIKVNSSSLLDGVETFRNNVDKSDIPSDGLVLTYDDIEYGKSLGNTAKTPRHSIAFKWCDEKKVTKIQYVEWSASRTGLINPIAVFEPVELEGTTVCRASLHNLSIMMGLRIGYGDSVEVYKANMIIPQIARNLTQSGTCEIPGECPECGAETEVHQDETSGVYTLYCTNPNCKAKGVRLLKHFVSRDAMNIDGISEKTLDKFIEEGLITTPSSIFGLVNKGNIITNLEGFGPTSFYNMVNAINKARNVKLSRLIYSLGIPNIGLQTAKIICKYFDYDIKRVVNANQFELSCIEGIGGVIAQSFCEYFIDSENRKEFMNIYKEISIQSEKMDSDNSMDNIVICVTGGVNIFKNRDQIKDIVEMLGGKLTGSVSNSTNYLVTNDTTSGSKKNTTARELGIPILTEEQLIERFELSKYI